MMIVVTNTIKVKKGHGVEVAERFRRSKGVHLQPGFVRMEVMMTEDLEEIDELKVCTTWNDKASFENWVSSDNFRQAHVQRRTGTDGTEQSAQAGPHGTSHGGAEGHKAQTESVMLGSKMTIHQVLVSRIAGEDE
ncbi:heme oxygenase (staphylobilin-producing) [Paenibacillus phyllosphaerae]|uniref:Heme oxygenase (Staphylobilin-producing) n=1 Tax=Paenibacillus phyllosphaerae TaxID=274593 RepID=A0A7W5B4S2_9BACL|nr:antibiotic biosynthesis monooxygenase [Paenibacillus phyllosphaerae]MBB3114257.1 heme oxygenase (staphylobilin-producing) [Paenibacillus phyllosphaerae]